jgi:hypothetical protein
LEKTSCQVHLKSHINTKFLHTSIIPIKISHAKDHKILFFASDTFLSSPPDIIIFIPFKTNIKIAIATRAISKKFIIDHNVVQKISLFIKIFLSETSVNGQVSFTLTSSEVFFPEKAL